MALMRINFNASELLLYLVREKSLPSISDYLKEWCPKWGNAGLDLSILDMPIEYVLSETTEEYNLSDYKKFLHLLMVKTILVIQ